MNASQKPDCHLFAVVFPIHDNDGTPYSEALLARFRVDLHSVASGFTCYPVSGEWHDDARRVFVDQSLRFEISGLSDLAGLRRLLSKWAGLLGQACLYLEDRGLVAVELITPLGPERSSHARGCEGHHTGAVVLDAATGG